MQFIWAFLIGGAICVIGQILMDVLRLTPAHTMSTLVVAGALVEAIPYKDKGLYDQFIEFAGAGATVPITSFGNSLVNGALSSLKEDGPVGIIGGIFEVTSAGISAAIIFSFLAALVFRPQG
ncbi:stage V sporulation protein AE [Paenibacillus validus]|uniref:Stage V sporulation protein AE n=1 Tax=Paenibacillus validus TaxID=44253 RepID=A0A7X2Z6Z8_9BACL|nr:stage V sporulation protein AE [Paenibacillus validus]MUG69508.1 stage V sporulation protein AE [Paenibacillus validus]